MPEERTVPIPAREQHGGLDSITVTLPWVCRQCGAPPWRTLSGLELGRQPPACGGWLEQPMRAR